MEELRIKCPSCGIVLDVRNSKNEAVKRITCPNCKKQLAVTFRETPKPAQYVDIKMVQLNDGSQKTIVRALTDDHEIKVNGERLLKDDEVVLAPGDRLEIDGILQFAPQTNNAPSSISPAAKPEQNLTPVKESRKIHWFFHFAIIAVIIAVFIVWKKCSDSALSSLPQKTSVDTIISTQHPEVEKKKTDESKAKKEVKKDVKKEEQKPEVKPGTPKSSHTNMSEYDLERLAIKGDAEAQYLLGKRWVNKGDSVNVVKGIKYLKLAAQNGSSEARTTLRRVFTTLQQSANSGSTTASNILREQR